MDINGTYFHMLNGDDWRRELQARQMIDLWWDSDRASLSLLPQILKFDQKNNSASSALAMPVPQLKDRRGAARDRYANSYWISEDKCSLYVMPAGSEDSAIYWSLQKLADCAVDEHDDDNDFSPLKSELDISEVRLSGLTVSTHQYLLVGTLQPGGLLIFDLHGGGPPSWYQWPAALNFSPFDMAADAQGGVAILDSNLQTDTARYWQLDRYFRIINPAIDDGEPHADPEADFSPLNPAEENEQTLKIIDKRLSLQQAITLTAQQAISIESFADGSVLILASSPDNRYSVLQHIVNGVESSVIELRDDIISKIFENLSSIKAHDFALLTLPADFPGQVKVQLNLLLKEGNQALSFSVEIDKEKFDIAIQPRYIPLRQFSGKALMAGKESIFYDAGKRWYPLTAQPRRRYISEAVIDDLVFDGKQSNCVWHRIIIDGCIPDATSIDIESRWAEEKELLEYSEWQSEVNPYLRGDGSEIPFHQAYTDEEKQTKNMGTWEWLIQNARGRYLELRIRFSGNGRDSPRIKSMRVYYPRFSYLQKFLPAVYRENEFHASFLERYLANVEGFFSKIENVVASSEQYFDTRTAPAKYLQWLASWLGAAMNEEWSESRQRLFIDHAELMFRWRGTRIGMRAAIRLTIEECPDERVFEELKQERNFTPTGAAGRSVRIVEKFMYRNQSGVNIGDPAQQQGVAVTSVSDTLSELGDNKTLNQRYAEFIYNRYLKRANSEIEPLTLLNQTWQRDTEFTSFNELEFNQQRPENTAELQDWNQFIRQQLALLQTWEPAYGSYALHVRFQEYSRKKYSQAYGEEGALQMFNQNWNKSYASFEDITFTPLTPGVEEAAEDWIDFTETSLGFKYAQVGEKDTQLYQQFLARRYKQINRLNQTYGLAGEKAWVSFEAISLPAEEKMPSAPAELQDWIQFVSLMLPIRSNAHRFTVMVPTDPEELPQSKTRRMQQVAEIVRREKPAHTDFDVKLYWALFQVGSARLGLDTSLGEGARYVAIVLAENYLGQGMLDSSHPWNITDRHIIGRDQLQRS